MNAQYFRVIKNNYSSQNFEFIEIYNLNNIYIYSYNYKLILNFQVFEIQILTCAE